MRVLLAPNPYRDPKLRCARKAEKILRAEGADTALCPLFTNEEETDRALLEQLAGADAVVAFGGDGTILHTAKLAAGHDVPVLGVNLGRTGFLAGASGGDLAQLKQLPSGGWRVEEHMMLRARALRGRQCLCDLTALNDVILSKSDLMSAVDLTVEFDRIPMFRMTGDGVIVATPTGSTAYSLSAGGPVMEHTLRSIIVTPICPHRLDARAHILYPDRKVRVIVEPHSGTEVLLSVDGRKELMLRDRDKVEIGAAEKPARLIRLGKRDFYENLREKLVL